MSIESIDPTQSPAIALGIAALRSARKADEAILQLFKNADQTPPAPTGTGRGALVNQTA
jgi:hypothetical protein